MKNDIVVVLLCLAVFGLCLLGIMQSDPTGCRKYGAGWEWLNNSGSGHAITCINQEGETRLFNE